MLRVIGLVVVLLAGGWQTGPEQKVVDVTGAWTSRSRCRMVRRRASRS